ncbi:uncharacterized protein PHALS_02448 [Plasmopara halstedii]|uniref:Transmembrane protein 107 n=1 Tax=Plasmopara halstedii TaxID=4781 RepID=A0A0P1A6W6_PLAHL|nr:uncharacterized protein PHALS_02448 [Plasmopara halstedii]CEG36358.1 hypothetical protein PHALS_02448 [Plasmopara halstedii]|eukprot:XP_024572727.1 hypothetical protein PHALS_02448 [Plasmopara halstedii]
MSMAVLRARFMLTSGHMLATCLVGMQASSILTYLSFTLAFGSLIAGLDILSPLKNAVFIVCHVFGGVSVCQVILHDLDPAQYMWCIVLLIHLPISMCTLDTITRLIFLKTARY